MYRWILVRLSHVHARIVKSVDFKWQTNANMIQPTALPFISSHWKWQPSRPASQMAARMPQNKTEVGSGAAQRVDRSCSPRRSWWDLHTQLGTRIYSLTWPMRLTGPPFRHEVPGTSKAIQQPDHWWHQHCIHVDHQNQVDSARGLRPTHLDVGRS